MMFMGSRDHLAAIEQAAKEKLLKPLEVVDHLQAYLKYGGRKAMRKFKNIVLSACKAMVEEKRAAKKRKESK